MSTHWISHVFCKRDLSNAVWFGVRGKTDDVVEIAGMDVWLAVGKLHFPDDWSADVAQLFSCARMTVVENTRMDSDKLWPLIDENIIQMLRPFKEVV